MKLLQDYGIKGLMFRREIDIYWTIIRIYNIIIKINSIKS